ncbi:unnamed protein product [Acanthoscelides obtectus]|uniref:Uncharacterized protein n=1 Tax=Acanthoscelides obtectus TaxID=200917 RepID=A0A9P0LAA4_ACAOB|nr:unnamed protein product [Acanthoscelides obtectus]CAK1632936.1 hypothetical protein AOBTE_LOCUS7831 [Acanthoscelides obtectus]
MRGTINPKRLSIVLEEMPLEYESEIYFMTLPDEHQNLCIFQNQIR